MTVPVSKVCSPASLRERAATCAFWRSDLAIPVTSIRSLVPDERLLVGSAALAVCIAGLGVAVFDMVARATSIVWYRIVAWSLLIEVVGGIGALNSAVLNTSGFHHMAPAPAVSPDWGAAGGDGGYRCDRRWGRDAGVHSPRPVRRMSSPAWIQRFRRSGD